MSTLVDGACCWAPAVGVAAAATYTRRAVVNVLQLVATILSSSILLSSLALQSSSAQSLPYDATAYNNCFEEPLDLLYGGGILTNPDFDDGLEGWSPFGSCNLELRSSSSSSSTTSNALLTRSSSNDKLQSTHGKLISSSFPNHTDEEEVGQIQNKFIVATSRTSSFNGPSQLLPRLASGVRYTVSAWLRVEGVMNKSVVKATLMTDGGKEVICVGNVVAHNGCWSFLKGGFSLDYTPTTSPRLYFETVDFTLGMELWLDRASVQPFLDEEWKSHQNAQIHKARRRRVSMRIVDSRGRRLHDAHIEVLNANLAFNFGSAFPKTLLNDQIYQDWFLERFNTAVFENELKWYSTEQKQGHVDYSVPDAMLAWCEAHKLRVRGHNVVWNDPNYQQQWIKALAAGQPALLRQALMDRVSSVVGHYTGRFIGWDVSNEQLHFSFYENALSDPRASTELFLRTQQLDPAALLFINDYNTLESTNDWTASPDGYSAALRSLSGVRNLAVGLEAHFTSKPNLAYIRAALDKLATLGCPIWLTELDVKDPNITSAAAYLHDVLLEAFSHSAISGIVLWSGLHSSGCYRMCLTDPTMANLPTGDVVDALLRQWRNVTIISSTGGALTWRGPVGDHSISIHWRNATYSTVVSVPLGNGTHHLVMRLPTNSSS